MFRGKTVLILGVSIFLLAAPGCATTDGGSSGWVVIGDAKQPPPQTRKEPKRHPGKGEGLEVAARNHIRSAYRFLQKGKPDHALRELEKARDKMGRDYWFHYHMGGAYYLKGMHAQARNSWEMAFSFSRDHRLRSRARTCQSFVIFRIQGQQPTIGFLRKAVDLDRDNRVARTLLDDLFASRQQPDQDHSTDDDQPAYVKDMLKGSKYGTGGDKNGSDRDGGSDDRKLKTDKKGKAGQDKGKRPDKKSKSKEKKKYRIEDKDQFTAYFFVEMPD